MFFFILSTLISSIILISFTKFLLVYVWSFSCNSTVWEKIEDKYVVVTGATQEIGKEICRQLVTRRVKLLMVDKNRQELEKLKNELSSKIDVDFYVVDFNLQADNYNVFSFIEDYEVGLLINAENTVDKGYETFINRRNDLVINTNILSTTHITHRVITQMITKRCGFVVFIGEATFNLPVPFCSIYSATAAFRHQLALSLYYELEKYGIVVEYVRYGSILRTCVNKKYGICRVNPRKFAAAFLRTFGSARETIPVIYQMFLHCLVFCIPNWIIGHFCAKHNEDREIERELTERKLK